MKIKKISKKTYEGKVYDLSVKDVHSYNINGLGVHNSAAGSIISYLLDITTMDPIKFKLPFERFLAAEYGHIVERRDLE